MTRPFRYGVSLAAVFGLVALLRAQSLAPSMPAKEFIYFGERLLAVSTAGGALVGVYRNSGPTWYLDLDGNRTWNGDPPDRMTTWTSGGQPVFVDWSGDDLKNVGVFLSGSWYIDRNGDGAYQSATELKSWGSAGDTAAPGDWNGSGVKKLAVVTSGDLWFRDRNGDFIFDAGTEFHGWGPGGSTPVPADWNGDGKDQMAVYNGGAWFIDFDDDAVYDPGDTPSEYQGWGSGSNTPVVCDWNGDGKADLGAHDASTGTWFLDLNGNYVFDAGTEIIGWGVAGSKPIVGDWDNDGDCDIGAYDGSFTLDLNGNRTYEHPAEAATGFGLSTDFPLAGKW